MTKQQQRFIEEYCIDGNGAAAAVRAGYSAKTARQKAWELQQNEAIADAIRERYISLAMSSEEATKRISDNAATRLNDYMTVEEVWEEQMVKMPLANLIANLQLEIEIEEEVADRLGLFNGNGETDKNDKLQDDFFLEQAKRKAKIVRYEVELEKNPAAYRYMKGEPQLVKRASVDLIKLAKADEKGSIKKLSFNERGLPSVECYSAENALETVLKLHGKLIQKHEVEGNLGVTTVDTSKMTTDQRAALLLIARNRK